MFLHYLVKLVLITVAADFNGILHVSSQNSSCEIRGRLNSSGLNLVGLTIKCRKQTSTAKTIGLHLPK